MGSGTVPEGLRRPAHRGPRGRIPVPLPRLRHQSQDGRCGLETILRTGHAPPPLVTEGDRDQEDRGRVERSADHCDGYTGSRRNVSRAP
jgi:hypothetical protein